MFHRRKWKVPVAPVQTPRSTGRLPLLKPQSPRFLLPTTPTAVVSCRALRYKAADSITRRRFTPYFKDHSLSGDTASTCSVLSFDRSCHIYTNSNTELSFGNCN
jgi:hypothetical protein